MAVDLSQTSLQCFKLPLCPISQGLELLDKPVLSLPSVSLIQEDESLSKDGATASQALANGVIPLHSPPSMWYWLPSG